MNTFKLGARTLSSNSLQKLCFNILENTYKIIIENNLNVSDDKIIQIENKKEQESLKI